MDSEQIEYKNFVKPTYQPWEGEHFQTFADVEKFPHGIHVYHAAPIEYREQIEQSGIKNP